MFPRDSENSETDQFILEASDEAITLAAGTGLGCTGFCEESPEQDEGGSKGMLARLKEAVEKGYIHLTKPAVSKHCGQFIRPARGALAVVLYLVLVNCSLAIRGCCAWGTIIGGLRVATWIKTLQIR
jgi:hypothetical protein